MKETVATQEKYAEVESGKANKMQCMQCFYTVETFMVYRFSSKLFENIKEIPLL